jgi:hypothetical protein
VYHYPRPGSKVGFEEEMPSPCVTTKPSALGKAAPRQKAAPDMGRLRREMDEDLIGMTRKMGAQKRIALVPPYGIDS